MTWTLLVCLATAAMLDYFRRLFFDVLRRERELAEQLRVGRAMRRRISRDVAVDAPEGIDL